MAFNVTPAIRDDATELFITLFGRAPDRESLGNRTQQLADGDVANQAELAAEMLASDEGQSIYASLTTREAVEQVYDNTLDRAPSQQELNLLSGFANQNGGPATISLFINAILNGNPNNQQDPRSSQQIADDKALLENKVAASTFFAIEGPGTVENSQALLESITADTDTSTDAALQSLVTGAVNPIPLTQQDDDLTGTGGGDTFTASLAQNNSGGVTNTLASGDTVSGGEGTDALEAALIPEDTEVGGTSPVIGPNTSSVENVFFQSQGPGAPLLEAAQNADIDFGSLPEDPEDGESPALTSLETGLVEFANQLVDELDDIGESASELGVITPVTIDAGNMDGVEQLWSEDSRQDLVIEDVSERPQDTIIGMRDTDPFVSYEVKFDSDVISNPTDVEDSSVTYSFANLEDPSAELEIPGSGASGGWAGQLEFVIDGNTVTLDDTALQEATTYTGLESAVNTALDNRGFTELTVSLNENFNAPQNVGGADGAQLTITDEQGRTLSGPSVRVADAAPGGALFFDSEVGEPQIDEELVRTDVVLDNAGSQDEGGVLDIGGMSNKSVESIDVVVDQSSWLNALTSTSETVDPETGSDMHLDKVFVTSQDGGAEGDLVLGGQNGGMEDPVTDLPTGGRVTTSGLTDVKTFDASGFDGAVNLGASLTSSVFARYLDDAQGEQVFAYTGSDEGNIFTLAVDNGVSLDTDFNLEVTGGAGDDNFNLVGSTFALQSVEIDGGGGNNVLETSSSINVDATSEPESLDNIDELFLAGGNTAVDADMSGVLSDLDEVVIATDGTANGGDGSDSDIANLSADQSAVIDGQKQQGNDGNVAQAFGTISFTDANVETLDVEINNAARTADLTIDSLDVVSDDGSAVRTVNVSSNGDRTSSNIIANADLAEVTALNLDGSQDLTATVDNIGTNADGDDVAFDIDGSALGGDLDLSVDATNIEGSNANDEAVTLTGTGGDNDRLTLFSGGSSTTTDITSDTTVSEFEEVTFGSSHFAGEVDVANFSGVETYFANDLSPSPLILENMADGDTFQIGVLNENGEDVSEVLGQDITLSGPGAGALNVDVVSDYSNTLTVNEFATLNLDVEAVDTSGDRLDSQSFGLATGDGVSTLDVSGGQNFNTRADDGTSDFGLDLGEINPDLGDIEFQDFDGSVNASFVGSLDGIIGDPTGIDFGESDASFALDRLTSSESTNDAAITLDTSDGSSPTVDGSTDVTFSVNDTTSGNSDSVTISAGDFGSASGLAAAIDGQTLSVNGDDTVVDVSESGGVFDFDLVVDADTNNSFNVELDDGSTAETSNSDDLVAGGVGSKSAQNFSFTSDGRSEDTVWTIENFITFEESDGTEAEFSELDVSGLGVEDRTDLDIDVTFGGGTATPGDADDLIEIRAQNNEFQGTIELVGVDADSATNGFNGSGLQQDNFNFA